MKNKDRFLTVVFAGALARDLADDTHEAQAVARIASQVPEEKVPTHPENAAKVFLSYCYGTRTRPFKWMFPTSLGIDAPDGAGKIIHLDS